MKRTFIVLSGSVLTVAVCAGVADAGEKHIKYNDLPSVVQTTAQRESKGATVRGYIKDVENGKVEYEVEMMTDGKSRDVTIDPSGKVIEVEQQIELDAVPIAAMTAIRSAAGGGSIRKVEEVRSQTETAYEADVLNNGKHREIRVHADGSAAPEQD